MSHEPHAPQLVEISASDLSHVTGGFLPLLGLLGPIAGIAGQIMDGIGKKKAQKAQDLMSQSGQGADASSSGSGSAAAGTNVMPQPQASSSDS
ncbi:MAG TPA: hypothetical protein VGC42_07155 [Kofleriaceae bacterium]